MGSVVAGAFLLVSFMLRQGTVGVNIGGCEKPVTRGHDQMLLRYLQDNKAPASLSRAGAFVIGLLVKNYYCIRLSVMRGAIAAQMKRNPSFTISILVG